MAHKCVVGGCPKRSDTIIHYILPEEPRRRSQWLQFIERSKPSGEELIPQASRVCGDHFSADSFIQLDLGFTTRLILNIDAVPTIYCSDHATKDGIKEQAAGPGKEVDETCSITISSTVSLACVKEEPFEYEVSHVEGTKSAPTGHSLKPKEGATCSEGIEQVQVKQRAERSKDNKRFSCSTCGEVFRNKYVLMEHENNHMEDQTDRIYLCNQCGKGFQQQAFLKAHEKSHKEAKPGVKKATVSNGVKQERTPTSRRFQYQHASPGKYKCPFCEEVHNERATFTLHVKTVHTGCKLVCSFCDRSFGRMEDFFKHIDRHVVVTPFYCSICRVYQLNKQGYMCHMRIHKNKDKGQEKGTTLSHTKWTKEEAIKEQMQTEEASEMEAESVESEETGTVHIVPELDVSLPSPEELSYTDSSGETEDSSDIDGTDDR